MIFKNFFLVALVFLSFSFKNAYSQNDKKNITLSFIGDFMGHQDQIDAAYNKITKTYDYEECFDYVNPILSKADFTLGNLEVTLGVKPYSGYPQFSSPASFASAIKNAGVDVLVTANNHSCDKRKLGLERTIKILDSLEIKHTGTFISKEHKDKLFPLILNKNGFTIAVINYTYGTNEIPPTPPNIVNYLKEDVIKNDIEKAKLKNPDVIIAFVHWGIQYKDMPSNSQKKWYNFFKEQGVSIVIGSHPHVLQPMILDKSKNELVVYSLGNFISHQRTFPRDGGTVFNLELSKENNEVSIVNANYDLTWVYEPIIDNQKKYYILPIAKFENDTTFFSKKKDFDKMIRFSNHAKTLLNKENIDIKINEN